MAHISLLHVFLKTKQRTLSKIFHCVELHLSNNNFVWYIVCLSALFLVCLFVCLFVCFWLSCLNCFCIIYVIFHVFALTYVLRDWHFVLYFYCNLITFRNWYSIILHYFILFCVVFYHLLISRVIIYIFLHVFS